MMFLQKVILNSLLCPQKQTLGGSLQRSDFATISVVIHRCRYDFGDKAGFTLFLCLSLLALSIGVWPQQANPADTVLEGEVIKIADGDTLTLLTSDKRQVKVRLAEIDAPERGQPYGQKAKQALADKVFRQMVTVEIVDRDRYGREVGKIYLDGDNVNMQMVAEGHVWVYRQYSKDPALLELEAAAKEAGSGLWALPESGRIPPWEWRRGVRNTEGQSTQEGADPNCRIKGNINNKGDHIYHVPGSHSYDATKINEAKGERWFCIEEDARNAGWRPPNG
jgi:endonuclease YncB( thermonuclease family)